MLALKVTEDRSCHGTEWSENSLCSGRHLIYVAAARDANGGDIECSHSILSRGTNGLPYLVARTVFREGGPEGDSL